MVESSPPKKTCDAETDDESTLSHDNDETSRSSDDQNDDDVEIGPWAELIDEVKQRTSSAYEELLQNLIYEGYDEQEAKTEAYSLVLPKLEKALEDVYLERLLWMRELKQDPMHKTIMRTRDAFVNDDEFEPEEALAAAINKRKFLLKKLLNDGRFDEDDD